MNLNRRSALTKLRSTWSGPSLISRSLVPVLALSLLVMVPGPSSATPADPLRIGSQRVTGTWDINGVIPYAYRAPKLLGGSRAMRKLFAQQTQRLVMAEKVSTQKPDAWSAPLRW